MNNHTTTAEEHIYQQFIDDAIAQTIQSIQHNTHLAQSEQGQLLLTGLADTTSDVYKQAVAEAIENAITEIENTPTPTPEQQQLLQRLTQKRDAEKPQLQTEQIPHDIMLQTIESIICGKTRTEIAKHLIEQQPTPAWLQPIAEMDTTDAIKLIAQRLRAADPTSKRFAHTKYQHHAETVQEKVQQQFNERLYALVDAQLLDFENTDKHFKQRIEQAERDIEHAQHTPTEKRQLTKLWMQLNEQRDHRNNTFLTHLHNILAAKKPS